ncbi:B3 domain-containing protein Os01g0905400-like isoform X1 [Juglans regia]|uniref:B3 domain-containing protein Os01g0905400-like isoform X1 n=2 Tax=Juglans regia TaxID=51240 RepID=A0A2I4FZS5_JUGRE|nr:B3 domain-containing protein Os01g0905400-like isoform X1 [Juglans regia]XP_018837148.2 B3 domain-containing protein Os01g0905400-like isoform X1 [Juglans regia]XP_018837149.2 B3 domain-containing protein Os01g0905400-like isoform X1 [Juglans regia]XP_018837150.2 B3 domain-containing protein Os01g0905400-like isoform X1 [Juglans regia]
MGCKAEACKECTQKCLLVHQRKKNSTIGATAFFKVMIGDQFSKVLFLPPKFAATVSSLVDQETFLEDSSGRQWNVALSNLNGSLAFERGWGSFALDHGLEVGNFLVFDYVMGSGFVVKIFNTTGCEKVDFPENSDVKKRARINGNSASKHDQCHKNEGSMNKQASSTSAMSLSEAVIHQSQCEPNDVEEILRAPEDMLHCDSSNGGAKHLAKAEYTEEPFYLINRDLRDNQGYDRNPAFDLFNFETWNNSGADVTGKAAVKDGRFPYDTDISLNSQMKTCFVVKDPAAKGMVSGVAATDALDFETIEKSHCSKEISKKASASGKNSCKNRTSGHLLTTSAMRLEGNKENISDMPIKGITKCQIAEGSGTAVSRDLSESMSENNQVALFPKENTSLIDGFSSAKQEFNGMSELVDVPVTTEMHDCQTRLSNDSKMIDRGHSPSSDMIAREKYRVAKVQLVDSVGTSSTYTACLSCLVAKESQSFLELPTCLPSSYHGKGRMERRVVFLQDPAMRLWPVLYHERSGFTILTSGWEAFSKANGIQPGDECVFGVERASEGIYGVRIARK